MFTIATLVEQFERFVSNVLKDTTEAERRMLDVLYGRQHQGHNININHLEDCLETKDREVIETSLQYLARRRLISITWFEGCPVFSRLTYWGSLVVKHGLRTRPHSPHTKH